MGTAPRREPFAVPAPEPARAPRPRGVASNPGGVKAHYLKHALCYPTGTMFVVVLVSGGAALALTHHGAWWCLAALGALLQVGLWRSNRQELLLGDLLPGVVLKEKPWTVAVYANLSIEPFKQRPALKILRQPLGRMTGGPPKVGDYIPMVASYGVPRDDGTWGDIWPDPVGCNTFDAATVADAARRINPADAAALEDQLAQLEEWNEGMYRMWFDVAEFEEAGVNWLELLKGIGLLILALLLIGVVVYAKFLRHFLH